MSCVVTSYLKQVYSVFVQTVEVMYHSKTVLGDCLSMFWRDIDLDGSMHHSLPGLPAFLIVVLKIEVPRTVL